jgi:hypothetical protein
MMRVLGAALLLVLAAAPSSGSAQAQPAGQEETRADARALAELVSPAELYMGKELAVARQAFFAGLESDPDSKALEAEHPGISKALWAAVEPELRKSLLADLPGYRGVLARVYQQRLTAAEIAALRTFYATDVGRRLIRTMLTGLDAQPMIDEMIADPDGGISMQAATASIDAAKKKAVGQITDKDAPALMQLQRSMDLKKMNAVGVEIRRATLEWANAPDPELDALMEKTISEAARRFFEAEAARR